MIKKHWLALLTLILPYIVMGFLSAMIFVVNGLGSWWHKTISVGVVLIAFVINCCLLSRRDRIMEEKWRRGND